ncbi:LytR family transcriptional regulator [Corynebacterium diphtheriae]|uniref:LCP family protein n=1 Tax=Corynebacterium diphtheriae TaxID=1717 RepID=UPI0002468CEC|nr:LCP family protein [Corynebacterium diphtheriae]AEX80577.1 membrane-bound protein [Corynebacterium diphtheriae HC04]MBG9277312.1 LCP family protein [Corynebacterium diphtheriae bv. mitis]MBG9281903.1 LCP family protein [Corynebacterium diphtheriae bv. mitis]MBG9293875.1 LCP family protein [Corynebacterium diphtheriae bv. mitis]MBG9337207.1 LCP family protein [Corynebacterium diphtheriae bv. mitis]
MSDNFRRNRAIQAPPPAGPTTAQAGPKPVKVLLSLLSALVLIVSAAGYFTVGRIGNTVASAGNLVLGGDKGMKEAADGATDILLVGSDSRTDAQGNPLTPEEIELLHAGDEENDNTDTLMVIRVPNDGSSATAISIPRDTYVHDENVGNLKINGVYRAYKNRKASELVNSGESDQKHIDELSKEAGRKALISSISDLTGVTVDHYAEVGLLGFVLLTNAVGGVDVCLNNDVYDEFSGADFKAGQQTLRDGQALAFVRQRHGLPRGDLDRIVRQQAFMASLVAKVLSSGTLTNPSKLSDLGEAVSRSVVIDKNWDVMSFANQLQNLAGGNVKFNTIPVTSIDGVGDYGESVVTVDKNQVHQFFDRLLNGNNGEEAPTSDSEAPAENPHTSTTIDVLNATSTTGLASQVAGHLSAKHYTIGNIGNALEGMYHESQIVAADPNNEAVKAIAAELGGLPITQRNDLDADSVVVVIASDYSGPTGDGAESSDSSSSTTTVGKPGSDEGEAIVSPEIDAGGQGPRCVN